MRRKKILWITFWMTMVYWLGGAIGCATNGNDENYKILDDDDNDSSQTNNSLDSLDSFSDQPTDQASPDALLADASPDTTDNTESESTQPTDSSNSNPTPPTEQPTPTHTTPTVTHAPSLTQGMNRSHWPKIQVGPASGRVAHLPIYFRDLAIHDHLQRPVSTMPFGQRIEAALDGDMAAGYDSTNLFATFAQPAKFVVDGLLLPIHAVFDLPFQTVTTPK